MANKPEPGDDPPEVVEERQLSEKILSERVVFDQRVPPDEALVLEVTFPYNLRTISSEKKDSFRKKIIAEIIQKQLNGIDGFIEALFDYHLPFILSFYFIDSAALKDKLAPLSKIAINEDSFIHLFRCALKIRKPPGTTGAYLLENLTDTSEDSIKTIASFVLAQNDWTESLATSVDVPKGYIIEPNGKPNAVKLYLKDTLKFETLYRANQGFVDVQSPAGANYKVYVNPDISLRCNCCHNKGHLRSGCPLSTMDEKHQRARLKVLGEVLIRKKNRDAARRKRKEEVKSKNNDHNAIPGSILKPTPNAEALKRPVRAAVNKSLANPETRKIQSKENILVLDDQHTRSTSSNEPTANTLAATTEKHSVKPQVKQVVKTYLEAVRVNTTTEAQQKQKQSPPTREEPGSSASKTGKQQALATKPDDSSEACDDMEEANNEYSNPDIQMIEVPPSDTAPPSAKRNFGSAFSNSSSPTSATIPSDPPSPEKKKQRNHNFPQPTPKPSTSPLLSTKPEPDPLPSEKDES